MSSNFALLLSAGIAVAGLIFLIVRLKVSAFVALIIASLFVGVLSGMEPGRLMKAFQDGVGGVLGSIAVIIGLGAIMGRMLAESGGAEAISAWLVRRSDAAKLPWAFLTIGLIIGLPVFFGVGLVLLVPVLYASATRYEAPLLRLGLPMVAGLSAAHGFIPPHPGPLAAIELLGADLGKTILYSLPVAALSAIVAGPVFVRLLRKEELEPRRSEPVAIKNGSGADVQVPSTGTTLAVILLPVILMGGSAFLEIIPSHFERMHIAARFLGHPTVALLIGVILAWRTIGRQFGREQILKFSEESLGPVAGIILVIGAGAGFSRVLIESGTGKAIADLASDWRMPAVPMGFLLASLIRVTTGSATVAITTCAGLIQPIAKAQPGTNLELLVLAMGAGSLILSHVNDGGFWLVKGYLNLSVPQALRTWTIVETILALMGFGCVLILDLFF